MGGEKKRLGRGQGQKLTERGRKLKGCDGGSEKLEGKKDHEGK